jgi:hypothetical protein
VDGGINPRSLTGTTVGGGAGDGVGDDAATFPVGVCGVTAGITVSNEMGVIGGRVADWSNSVGVGNTSEIRGRLGAPV